MTIPNGEAFDAIKDLVIFGVAVLGAGLGVMNYWRAVEKDKIRLRVGPCLYYGEDVKGLCIDVVNIGFVPITVQHAGIEIGPKKEWYYYVPRLSNGGKLPHRLGPRDAITIYLPPEANSEPRMQDARCAFAKTACGLYFRGTSPAFRSWKKKVGTGEI